MFHVLDFLFTFPSNLKSSAVASLVVFFLLFLLFTVSEPTDKNNFINLCNFCGLLLQT